MADTIKDPSTCASWSHMGCDMQEAVTQACCPNDCSEDCDGCYVMKAIQQINCTFCPLFTAIEGGAR